MAAEFSEKDINLKIFVGELKKTVTEEELKEHFSTNIGPVTVSNIFLPFLHNSFEMKRKLKLSSINASSLFSFHFK